MLFKLALVSGRALISNTALTKKAAHIVECLLEREQLLEGLSTKLILIENFEVRVSNYSSTVVIYMLVYHDNFLPLLFLKKSFCSFSCEKPVCSNAK